MNEMNYKNKFYLQFTKITQYLYSLHYKNTGFKILLLLL